MTINPQKKVSTAGNRTPVPSQTTTDTKPLYDRGWSSYGSSLNYTYQHYTNKYTLKTHHKSVVLGLALSFVFSKNFATTKKNLPLPLPSNMSLPVFKYSHQGCTCMHTTTNTSDAEGGRAVLVINEETCQHWRYDKNQGVFVDPEGVPSSKKRVCVEETEGEDDRTVCVNPDERVGGLTSTKRTRVETPDEVANEEDESKDKEGTDAVVSAALSPSAHQLIRYASSSRVLVSINTVRAACSIVTRHLVFDNVHAMKENLPYLLSRSMVHLPLEPVAQELGVPLPLTVDLLQPILDPLATCADASQTLDICMIADHGGAARLVSSNPKINTTDLKHTYLLALMLYGALSGHRDHCTGPELRAGAFGTVITLLHVYPDPENEVGGDSASASASASASDDDTHVATADPSFSPAI